MKKLYLSLFTLLFCLSTYAQRQILGQAIETKSKAPVVFATVSIKNSNLGVIADQDGYFRLPYRYKQRRDTIVITAIGYKRKEVPLWSLRDNEINIITIDIKTEALGVVNINADKQKRKKTLTVRQIIRKAIGNIPSNYPNSSHSYVGYYRDYKILDDEYFNLNEGIVESFDAGFNTHKIHDSKNQALLYSFNPNDNFKRNDLLDVPYDNEKRKYVTNAELSPLGGNELSILDVHNTIRNYKNFSFSFVEVLKKDFLENHIFKLIRKTSINDTPIYEIQFTTIPNATGARNKATGRIYVEDLNFAIHEIDYNGFQSNGANFQYLGYNTKKEPSENDFKLLYSIKINYKSIQDKMYLNYISFNNRFKVGKKFKFSVEDISYNHEENSFYFKFNTPILIKFTFQGQSYGSIAAFVNLNDISLKYKNNILEIKDARFLGGTVLKVTVNEKSLPKDGVENEGIIENLDYDIANLKDELGRKLEKSQILDVFQFREFFVQEVFTNKALPENIEFINKTKHLSESTVVNSKSALKYWVNTPLKTIKNN